MSNTKFSHEWLIAEKLGESNGYFLQPIPNGSGYLYENPFEPSQGGRSFAFDPDAQIFYNRHSERRPVTPAKYVGRCLGISDADAARLIRKAANTQIGLDSNNMPIPKRKELLQRSNNCLGDVRARAKLPRDVDGCLSSESFSRRTLLLTAATQWLFDSPQEPNRCAVQWAKERGWHPSWLKNSFRQHIIFGENPRVELEKMAVALAWTDEQKVYSGLWVRRDDESVSSFYVGCDYPIFFPLWMPVTKDFVTTFKVFGFRIRRVTPVTERREPKEPEVTVKYVPELRGYPSQIGLYGLVRENSPAQERLEGCRGHTVVLTEGISDMYACRRILSLDLRGETGGRLIAVVTGGSIQHTLWPENLAHIAAADRIIVAFNNDATYGGETGQKSALKAREVLSDMGLSCEILPTEALEGENDINDLLRKHIGNAELGKSKLTQYIIQEK